MSAAEKTDIGGLADTLANALKEYDQDVADAVKEAVDDTADEAVETIRGGAPRKTGKYAKGWRKKKAYESSYEKRDVVHNGTSYQLTHLLENGHVAKNTDRARVHHVTHRGFTAPRVHIAPAEQEAINNLEERIEKAVQKA